MTELKLGLQCGYQTCAPETDKQTRREEEALPQSHTQRTQRETQSTTNAGQLRNKGKA